MIRLYGYPCRIAMAMMPERTFSSTGMTGAVVADDDGHHLGGPHEGEVVVGLDALQSVVERRHNLPSLAVNATVEVRAELGKR